MPISQRSAVHGAKSSLSLHFVLHHVCVACMHHVVNQPLVLWYCRSVVTVFNVDFHLHVYLQRFDDSIAWQPIPVHTVPADQDSVSNYIMQASIYMWHRGGWSWLLTKVHLPSTSVYAPPPCINLLSQQKQYFAYGG